MFEVPDIGSSGTKKELFDIVAVSLVCMAGFVCGIKHKKAKAQETSSVKEVYYVFFSPEGKSVTLSKKDVFDIELMHEDGVLPSVIGDKFGMDAIMVCRIIHSFNLFKKKNNEHTNH